MVWALIIVLALICPHVALALPDDVAEIEAIEAVGVDDLQSSREGEEDAEEDAVRDEERSEPDSVGDEVVSLVTYNAEGEILSTTEQPRAIPASRATYNIYASVTQNTYSEMATNMLWRVPWSNDYVFWRSGQYTYVFAYGDFTFSSGRFDCTDANIVTFQLDSNYNGTYTMSKSTGSVSLVPSSYIVYSNLGDYPLIDNEIVYQKFIVFMGCVGLAMALVRSVFSFTYRMGVRCETEH